MSRIIFAYPARLAMSASLAVLISMIVGIYFTLNAEYWVALTAFVVCLTSPGASLRQSLIIAALLIIALFAAVFLKSYINNQYIVFTTIAVSVYLTNLYIPLTNLQFAILTIIPLPFLLYMPNQVSDNILMAIFIGSIIGIVVATVIKFRKIEKEFKYDIAPLVKLICEYTNSLRIGFQETKFSQDFSLKNQIQNELAAWSKRYPEWIFNTGFNPGLRVGYRYFLIKVDQVVETLFSLSYWFTKTVGQDTMSQCKEAMKKVLQTNLDLLEVLSNFINDKALPTSAGNYLDDISELEAHVASFLPQSIELIDINADGLIISAIIKDLKDIRQSLIQLIAAIPA